MIGKYRCRVEPRNVEEPITAQGDLPLCKVDVEIHVREVYSACQSANAAIDPAERGLRFHMNRIYFRDQGER